MGATTGTLDELILRFRSFYKEAHPLYFDLVVKQVWLEQQLTYNGFRRTKRIGNGIWIDTTFGQFMRAGVGMNHRVITASKCFTPVSTYLSEFFPEFLFYDPFKNPEKYQYPYKNVHLDHLVFVYEMDNRLQLLEEAERLSMSYAEFVNWAINWVFQHNADIGRDKYRLVNGYFRWPHIVNNDLKKGWENSKYNFNVK